MDDINLSFIYQIDQDLGQIHTKKLDIIDLIWPEDGTEASNSWSKYLPI